MTLGDLPITFYPKRSSTIMLFLGSAVFVAAGVWMGTSGKPMGYFCAAFFGLGVIVATVQLIPGSAYLKLKPDGFEFAAMFRRHFVSWSDVSEFGVTTLKQTGVTVHKMVGFNYAKQPKRLSGRSVSRAVAGFEGCLPDCYGHKAGDLAEIMTRLHVEFRMTDSSDQGADGQQIT